MSQILTKQQEEQILSKPSKKKQQFYRKPPEIEQIKITIPGSEESLQFFASYRIFKAHFQSFIPEVKLNRLCYIHTPGHNVAGLDAMDRVFRPVFKVMQQKILVYALATKHMTVICTHRILRKANGSFLQPPAPKQVFDFTEFNPCLETASIS